MRVKNKLVNVNTDDIDISKKLIGLSKDKVTTDCLVGIVKSLMGFEYREALSNAIVNNISHELENASFMKASLSLKEEQRSILLKQIKTIVEASVVESANSVTTNSETMEIATAVLEKMECILDNFLQQIALESGRETALTGVVIKANTTGKETNELSIQFNKLNEVIVPSHVVLISVVPLGHILKSLEISPENLVSMVETEDESEDNSTDLGKPLLKVSSEDSTIEAFVVDADDGVKK